MRQLVIALLLAFALGACGGLSGEPDIVATAARPAATSIPAIRAWNPNLENGARIFAERCTDCHGESGDGLGELVLAGSVAQPMDMTDQAAVALKSPLAWFEIITEGRIDKLMPPWKNALTEAERWDVALYSYSLSYDDALLAAGEALWGEKCGDCEMPALIPPVFSDAEYGAEMNRQRFDGILSTQEIGAVVAFLRMQTLELAKAAAAETARAPLDKISGRVVHGTAGGIVPAGTVVQLQYGSAELGFNLAETTVDADFNFSFDAIPLAEEFTYVVSAVYRGRLFSRRLPTPESLDVTIELYDLTQDPAVLSISRTDIFVEAVELADLGRGLYISQIIGFRNRSDRIFTSGRAFDDGREAVLLARFPLGARVMSGADDGRYIVVEDMENIPDAIIDTLPVPPGDSHQVVLEYFLPYGGEATIEQNFNYQLEADVSVTLVEGLAVDSDLLQLEVEGVESEHFRVYAGRLYADGEPKLSLRISGDPFATSSDDRTIVTQESLLPLLAGAGALLAAILAAFGMARRRRDGAASEIDQLVAELARLDADHDQGRINHDLYHHKRRELKARLAELMAESE